MKMPTTLRYLSNMFWCGPYTSAYDLGLEGFGFRRDLVRLMEPGCGCLFRVSGLGLRVWSLPKGS